MLRKLMLLLLPLLLALPLCACGEEEWSGYNTVSVAEYTYGYQTSPQGNARLFTFTRNVPNEEFQLMLTNPAELERRMLNMPVALPDEANGMPVTEIDSWFLSGIETPTALTLPAHLVTIGERAFYRCNRLGGEVVLPKSVRTVGAYAFAECPKLTSVVIPRSVREIGEGAFTDCPNLTLTVVAGSAGEKHAIAHKIPYVYGDSTMPLDGVLTMPVTCYSLRQTDYARNAGGMATGSISANTPVVVTEIMQGYARAQLDGSDAFLPMDALSPLPASDPDLFGWHRDLSLDGKRLSDFESEELLYEYLQDVQLWNDYLFAYDAYLNSHLNAQVLREMLAEETYKNLAFYDTLLLHAPMDILFDLESLLGIDVLATAYHFLDGAATQQPPLTTMQTFVGLLGAKGGDYPHEAFAEFTDLYAGVKDFAALYQHENKPLTQEDMKRISDFFDKFDESPIFGKACDFLDDLFEAMGDDVFWKKVKPLLGKIGSATDEGIELLGALLPYLEISVTFVELDAAMANLTDIQRAAVDRLAHEGQGTYGHVIANVLLSPDSWKSFYRKAIAEQILGALREVAGKRSPYIAAFNAATTATSLMMHFDGTIDAASSQQNSALTHLLALETAVYGYGVEASQFLMTLPPQPSPEQLIRLNALVNEYARLLDLCQPSLGTSSDFVTQAKQAISRCMDADAADNTEPAKPLLFQYRPE